MLYILNLNATEVQDDQHNPKGFFSPAILIIPKKLQINHGGKSNTALICENKGR